VPAGSLDSDDINRTSQDCPCSGAVADASGSWLVDAFPDLAKFLLLPGNGRIPVVAVASADDNTFDHMLPDQVLPRFLTHRGQLLVHAYFVSFFAAVNAMLSFHRDYKRVFSQARQQCTLSTGSVMRSSAMVEDSQ
jgi:hypothetical protein